MIDTLITILISLFAFGFLISIHELGHFIAARIFGVTVKEFSIGMGPRLMWYESKRSGTTYALSMLPIGGYVSMAGEDEESDDPNAFNKKPAWQRFIITAAGATVNILFGFIAMMIIVALIKVGGTQVGGFATNEDMLEMGESVDITSRSESFLQKNDIILSVEGNSVSIADELSYQIMRHGNKPVDLVVLRDGVEVEILDCVFPTIEENGQVFGVMDFLVYEKEKDFFSFFEMSFKKTVLVIRMCWESIIDLITGRYTVAAISGPVGITGAIGDAVKDGLLSVLNLVVIISINLGFMNLLPIPALDGGRLLVLFVEMVFKKKMPERVEATINGVALAVLLLLSLVIMVKDIFTLI